MPIQKAHRHGGDMIKNILKGVVMGIANIIPGVSGGTMAVSMGIYDKMIHSVTHLFKDFKKSIAFLLPIFIGAGIGVVGLSFAIEKMFEVIPLETNFLFIGLIVGGLPMITKRVKGNKIKPGYLLSMVLFFALVVGLAAFGNREGTDVVLEPSVSATVQLFFVGIIASATMIVPGVSGSMVLLLIGFYNPIVEEINTFIRALVSFDMDLILRGIGLFAPLGVGIIVGIIVISKVIEVLLDKFPVYVFYAIIGLIIASPVAILLLSEMGEITALHIGLSVVTLGLGSLGAYKLGGE